MNDNQTPDAKMSEAISGGPTVFGVPMLTRQSPFSYVCHACSRCCHNQEILVNPFEVTVLARHLGISTTEFSETYTGDGPFLTRKEAGACVFLGPSGCTVHAARPTVCRMYPLGLKWTKDLGDRFMHHQPHPQTEGEYGTDGTVGDFLQGQGAERFLEAADRYFEVLGELLGVLRAGAAADRADLTEALDQVRQWPANGLSNWLDTDAVIAAMRPDVDPKALTPDQALDIHIEELRRWISELREENPNE